MKFCRKCGQTKDENEFCLRSEIRSKLSSHCKTCNNLRRKKWQQLVGYKLDEIRKHLENQFVDSMSWDNYGKYGWHIDHIRPISSFNFISPQDNDFKKCWALENLQPLWAKDNHSKYNKIIN